MDGKVSVLRAGVIAICVTLLSACGGGGGGSVPGAASPPAGGAPASGGSGGSTTQSVAAHVVVAIPKLTPSSARRARANVSPATQSFVTTLVSANGVAENTSVETDLTGPACTAASGSTSCTVTIDAPVGNDVFSVVLYAQPGGTGTVLGSVTAPQTIVVNSVNQIALDVNSTIGSMFLAINATTAASVGTPATVSAYVVALDPSGNIDVLPGNYTNPITVTSSDATGHVKLAVNGGTASASVQLQSPRDLLTIVYDGGGSAQTALVTASTPGAANAVAPFAVGSATPVAVTLTAGPYTGGGHAITFTSTAAAETATFNVTGGTPPYTTASSSASTATVAPAGPSTGPFTVTSRSVGSTTITVTDAAGVTTTIPVTVAAPSLSTTVTPGTGTTFDGTTLTMLAGETAGVALSGGSGIYAASSTDASVASVSAGTTSPYTISAVGTGTATIALGDTLGDTVASGPATIAVDVVAPISLSSTSISFAAYGAPGTTTITVSGGEAPYLVNGLSSQTQGNVTWTVSGNSIAVTANAAVKASLIVSDALGEAVTLNVTATTLNIPIQ
jgi:hypothetical protein